MNEFLIISILSVITVSFSQVAYNVNESDGLIQPTLLFSNPSSSDIALQVEDTSNTATGKLVFNDITDIGYKPTYLYLIYVTRFQKTWLLCTIINI